MAFKIVIFVGKDTFSAIDLPTRAALDLKTGV